MKHQDFRHVLALSDCYNTLHTLLNQYASVKKCNIKVRPTAPWYSDNINRREQKGESWNDIGATQG